MWAAIRLGVAARFITPPSNRATEPQENNMSKIVEGVPEQIARADYTRLIESVGFDPRWLQSLTFESGGIRARVVAKDAGGKPVLTRIDEDDFGVACDDVFIPITDEV